tara:strand:+ start:219 stop:434 length:216 start_codon:yes stop_codon:yes gene_type:complete
MYIKINDIVFDETIEENHIGNGDAEIIVEGRKNDKIYRTTLIVDCFGEVWDYDEEFDVIDKDAIRRKVCLK